jgi:hypothetical protein
MLSGRGAKAKIFAIISSVCAEPLKVYWFTLDCGAALAKEVRKRKGLECGTMKGEKRIRVFFV